VDKSDVEVVFGSEGGDYLLRQGVQYDVLVGNDDLIPSPVAGLVVQV
jgi:hypothetical protein